MAEGIPNDANSGEEEPERTSSKSKRSEEPLARKLRLETEAAELQSCLRDGVVSDVKTRVAWTMNLFPHTRNSDVALTLKYWELFQPELYNAVAMSPRSLFKLERETTIVRVRAKIQNEYQLFPAEAGIRRKRRELEEDVKEAVIEDKPERNIVFVYADETGKNADFVCVAAVWVLTGYAIFKLSHAIRTWQDFSPWANSELHFTDFKKHHLPALPAYLDLVANNREFLSFKVIAVERSTLKRPIDEIIRRLHEFMLIRGARHEIDNNRLKLPHEIRLTVDAEQSLDVIACSDIKSRVAASFKVDYGENLSIDDVSTISSHRSELVQLADVVAGAVNRRKNHKGERGYKDELADMIIERLDIQLKQDDIPAVDATAWLSI
jgi:hypothetical protein